MTNQNFFARLFDKGVRNPEAIFLSIPGGKKWTYGAINALSQKISLFPAAIISIPKKLKRSLMRSRKFTKARSSAPLLLIWAKASLRSWFPLAATIHHRTCLRKLWQRLPALSSRENIFGWMRYRAMPWEKCKSRSYERSFGIHFHRQMIENRRSTDSKRDTKNAVLKQSPRRRFNVADRTMNEHHPILPLIEL